MKKLLLALIASVTFFNVVQAQNDTMYVMKAGIVVGKYNVNTEVDSVIFYKPSNTIFTDSRDGNVYQTVIIGTQVWMAGNLKYLPSVVGSGTSSNSIPYYYVYGYNGTEVEDAKATANYNTYGVLYNWPAAMNGAASSTTNPSGKQGVCPTGWHLPSDEEWIQLIDYLGGTSLAGSKLKEIGTTHWTCPNNGATNETGFTALPGGEMGAPFYNVKSTGSWWTATATSSNYAKSRSMSYYNSNVGSYSESKYNGFSVRCVRD
jgi:uncharacterized protein (TIGR02145 family)